MASRWYVIHVYSGFEKKVAASIREQAEQKGLADKFEEILVPTEEVVEVKRGSKVSSEVFSGLCADQAGSHRRDLASG
jgi:transcription termination/antitermination protein NusG